MTKCSASLPKRSTLLQPTYCVTLLHPLLSSSNGGRQTLQATVTRSNTKVSTAGQPYIPMVVVTLLVCITTTVYVVCQCWLTFGSYHFGAYTYLDVTYGPDVPLRLRMPQKHVSPGCS